MSTGSFRGSRLATRWAVPMAGLVLIMAVLLTLAGLAWYERNQVIDRASERNELLARVLADHATRSVDGGSLAAATLAELLQRGVSPEGAEMRTALQQTLVNLPFLRGMAVIDAQGLVLASADQPEVGQLIDLAPLGALPAPGSDVLGPYVPARRLLDLVRSRRGGNTPPGVGFLPLVRGVQLGSKARVYIVGLLNPAAFANFQQLTLNDTRAAAALVSYEGQLIAASSTVQRAAGSALAALPPFTQFLPRIEQGSWIGPGLRDGDQIGTFRVSATRPLVVLVEFGRDDAIAEWWQRVRTLLAVGAAAVLLLGGMTWITSRSVRAREAAHAERNQAQAEVMRRERELRVTIQSLQELIFRTDESGTLLYANQRWATVAGSGDRKFWEWVVPAQRGAARALFMRPSDADVRHLQAAIGEPDGTTRTFDISVMPLHEKGQLVGFAGSAVDVSGRVVAQQRLQAQLAFTELLMEVSPLPCSVVDLQRRYVLVNQAWEDFNGRPRKEVIGQRAGRHLPDSERESHDLHNRELLQTRQPLRYEASVLHHDGSQRDVVLNKLLLPGDDGRPSGVLTVMIDVTEFRNAERATREARDAAEEASQAKSEFVANISHELRTPLQTIIGFSELGAARGRDQPRLAAMFTDIHGAGHRMLALVNDLLDVAKIESTVGTIHLERADLRGLVREVLTELQPLLNSRQLRPTLVLPELPMRAKVDPRRFQQVVRNVLANAIKFSPAGGRLEVLGEHADSGELCLSISDEGPGIPPAELDSIFEAFVQSSSTKDGSGGTGLGLAICRKIIDAHGGRIHAENRPQGGSVFRIHLPARATSETLPVPL